MAHRIREVFAKAPAVSNLVAGVAARTLGTWPARRLLESPTWGATAVPPDVHALNMESTEIALPANPYDVAFTSDGDCLFVTLQRRGGTQRTPGSIAVLYREGDTIRVGHQIPVPAAAWGLALLRDESLLAVANSHGVVLLDAQAARDAARDPFVSTAHYGRDLETVRVTESGDGRWLLASDEHNRTVSILNLDRLAEGAGDADPLVNQVPVDLLPVGMVLSGDGRHVYVTCEMRRVRGPDLVNWFVWGATLRGTLRRAGVLCTIDLERAVEDPAGAVVARAVAGGHPVRVVRSRDPAIVWVTARASNQLLAFSTERSASPELVATVPVGPAPVGLAVLEEFGVMLVANSNRFAPTGHCETLAVIDIACALAGKPATLGHIPVGSFPREIVVDASRRLIYVTNFNSSSLSMISISSLERAVETARLRAEH